MKDRTFYEFKNDLAFHRSQIRFLLQAGVNLWTVKRNLASHRQEIKEIMDDWEKFHPVRKTT